MVDTMRQERLAKEKTEKADKAEKSVMEREISITEKEKEDQIKADRELADKLRQQEIMGIGEVITTPTKMVIEEESSEEDSDDDDYQEDFFDE